MAFIGRTLARSAAAIVVVVAMRGVGGCNASDEDAGAARSEDAAADESASTAPAASDDAARVARRDDDDASTKVSSTGSHLDALREKANVVGSGAVAIPAVLRTRSGLTCPVVSLDATATNTTTHGDAVSLSSNLSFALPATVATLAGSSTNYVAYFAYTRPIFGALASQAQIAGATCLYDGASGTFQFVSCVPPAAVPDVFDDPSPGQIVAGNDFHLKLVPKLAIAATVEAHLDLGSMDADDRNACTTDTCGAHGGAVHTNVAAGTSCADGNACNGDELCDGAGVCQPGTPPTCSPSTSCAYYRCDPSVGCTIVPYPAGTSCADGNACNGDETCDGAGACRPGTPPVCQSNNVCVVAGCDVHSGCTYTNAAAGVSCSDGNACNGAETCNGFGGCYAGAPPSCSSSNPCVTAGCSPATGCTTTPKAAGVSCADANVCNGSESCDGAGTCVAGTPLSCGSSNPCIIGACDSSAGCTSTAASAGTSCSDGNPCNGAERCDGSGACASGTPPTLDDGNPCTVDACDPTNGVTHTPVPAGTSCSDGNACNGVEACDASGHCTAGPPPVLDDGNVCTADGCSPATGATHTAIPNCTPLPAQGDAPFEPRASVMGRLVTRSGGAITGATFTVTEAPPPDGSGVQRSDVSASVGGDGSFRLRLTAFPDLTTDRTPPLHVIVRVDAAGVLPAYREAWLHTGTGSDLGIIKMVPRDVASTTIGPAGGTANDSGNTVQVVIPPGALSSTINVVITPFNARDELPAVLPDSTATMYGFELEPSGTTFSAPVTVRIANTKSVPTTLSIPTGFYDPSAGRWEHVGQATWDGARFAFQTTHFTTYDTNGNRPQDPGVGPSAPPPPTGPHCNSACCDPGSPPPPGPEPGAGPDSDPGTDPGNNVGSRAGISGGSVSQSFRLPTYRVRSEDFGVSLGYDSGLAASRTLGAAPTDYQASPHAAQALPVRGVRLGAITLPDASAGTGTPRQPGVCGAQSLASFGQASPISLRAEVARGGSTTTQSFTMAANYTQVDFSGFFDIPVQNGQVSGSGLYGTHVVVTADSPGACVAPGGTFGVANVQSAGLQLAVDPGPLATFEYHELVHHRLTSPYGTGWTVQELSRVYRAGDVAFMTKGDGSSEKFRPRAYPHYLTQPSSGYAITRDPQTGEIFLARDAGDIQRVDATTGATTTILSGLPFSAGVSGAAVAYVGSARHFAVALSTSLVDVDAGGAATTLATRAAPPQFHGASVAARGDLVFYTDAASASLFQTRLSDSTHAVAAVSLASGGDVRLFPRAALGGVSFADPRGMDFGADGTLYVADVQRNVVYAVSPQANGEVGSASAVAPVVGDGTNNFLAPLGERLPGVKLALREPLAITTAEDGTLMVVGKSGVVWYDPLAREAEWLSLWAVGEELNINPTAYSASALAMGQNALLIRNTGSDGGLFLTRIDIDRLSSEFEPTRTLTPLSGGGLKLVDTTRARIEDFDSAGRIVQRKHRTGELVMGFSYVDAQSDKLDHVTDATGGRTTFAYDGAGKLQGITDARGRSTSVTVSALGDLTSFQEPDLETYNFTYDAHRMTQKQAPRGNVTTYTFHADGTVETLTKPGGQVTTIDPILSHAPTYDATGNLVRAGGYTDGHGVAHQIEVNSRGEIEKDTSVADGVTRVEQAVYATSETIWDANPADPLSNAGGTQRQNRIFRVGHREINGVPTGPVRRFLDAHYRVVREQVPIVSGFAHYWFYGPDGWLRAELAGESNLAQAYLRDAAGHLIQSYDTFDYRPSVPSVDGQNAQYTYRSDGQVATKTEHTVTTTYAYDDAGGTLNQLGWTDAVGRSMTYVLDARGNVTQTSDGTATTQAAYDLHNRVIETRDALGNATTYGYNATGCGCSQDSLVTNIHTPDLPAGIDWLMAYDGDGRLTSVTDPHAFVESYAYEPTGELKKLTDKLSRDTSWTHDQLGRVASMVDTLGRSHANAYAVPASGVWTGPTLMAAAAMPRRRRSASLRRSARATIR